MTKQEFILTFISVAIFLVLLVPTLIYKIRRERKLPTGEPVPVTQGQRFMALLGDAMWVGLLTLAGWGLFSGATLGYEFNHVDQKSAIEQAIHPAGSALLLGINVGYVLISLVGRLGVSWNELPTACLGRFDGSPGWARSHFRYRPGFHLVHSRQDVGRSLCVDRWHHPLHRGSLRTHD